MSALRFALVCWLLALTCAFLHIGINSALIPPNQAAALNDLIFSAVVTFPLFLAALGIKQRHEARVTKEQTIKKAAGRKAEKAISTTKVATFDYRPSRFKSVLLALVWPFFTCTFFYSLTQAITDFTLPDNRTPASTFFLLASPVVGCFMLYYSLVLLATARRAFGDKYRLLITRDQMSFPLKPYSKNAESIKLTDLTLVYVRKDKYDRETLVIKHNRGTSILWPSGFDSNEAFHTYAALASARVEQAHQEQVTLEFFIRALEDAPADIAEALLADETPELREQVKTHLQEQKQNTLKGTNNCHG